MMQFSRWSSDLASSDVIETAHVILTDRPCSAHAHASTQFQLQQAAVCRQSTADDLGRAAALVGIGAAAAAAAMANGGSHAKSA